MTKLKQKSIAAILFAIFAATIAALAFGCIIADGKQSYSSENFEGRGNGYLDGYTDEQLDLLRDAPENKDTFAVSHVYYVAPDGDNGNLGNTPNKAFKTVQQALYAVEKVKEEVDNNITIYLADGIYVQDSTLTIGVEHSLPNNKRLTIKAMAGATPKIVGGDVINNWEETTVFGKKMLKAKMRDVYSMTSFTVNGESRSLASYHSAYDRIKATWADGKKFKAFNIPDADFSNVVNLKQVELCQSVQWRAFVHRLASIEGSVVTMQQPFYSYATSPSEIGGMDPSGFWYPNDRDGVWLQNDVSFIDVRGEWCFNENNGYVYYYPLDGETIDNITAIGSRLDRLVELKGGSDRQNRFGTIDNLTIDGIVFMNSNFNLIKRQGLAIVQAQNYFDDAVTEWFGGDNKPDAIQPISSDYYKGAIYANYTQNLEITNCTFKAISKALHFDNGVNNAKISNCQFTDVGDSAIVLGNSGSFVKSESSRIDSIVIENNIMKNNGLSNFSAPTIQSYFASNVDILHNEISGAAFNALCIGWGWSNVLEANYNSNYNIVANKIYDFNKVCQDGGGLYFLGRNQNVVAQNNYIFDRRQHFAHMFFDSGASGISAVNNVFGGQFAADNQWCMINAEEIAPNALGWNFSVWEIEIKGNWYPIGTKINMSSSMYNRPHDFPWWPKGTDNHEVADGQWPKLAQDVMNNSGVVDNA